MIRPVYGLDRVVSEFVGGLIPGCGTDFGNCKAIGFAMDHKLVAGVVYHNWDPDAGVIEMSAAATRRDWTTKSVIRTLFEYPFYQVGCQMVVARISERNRRARRIWRAIGAVEHVIPRMLGRDEAQVISRLTVDAWESGTFGRFEHGQEK